ncbi:MAG: ATP phosphoribosyltransferase [Desulfobacterales bacterium]|nr:ATP phosphoribosyltransferase [Desulfobacterales bacterium]
MVKNGDKLNFAIPDGHLMTHVLPFIKGAGIGFDGYETLNMSRRPVMRLDTDHAKEIISRPDMVAAKVIRPQDMPAHVANGNFDLAVSGTDWLAEHKIRFPNSPMNDEPFLRLGFGKVRIVAAAHQDYGDDLPDFIRSFRSGPEKKYFRIASEYVYIADHFAQKNNFHPYRIIMTYGATESLIPEDCDMIIENTETGNTLRKNNLQIIDTLMKSEGCLIVNRESMDNSSLKRELALGIKTLFEEYLNSNLNNK